MGEKFGVDRIQLAELTDDVLTNKMFEDTGTGTVEQTGDQVTRVTYPDGKARRFGYDAQGDLKTILQPNGELWTRNDQGQWLSDNGKTFTGDIRVAKNGMYATFQEGGKWRLYMPDGTKKIFEFDVPTIRSALSDAQKTTDAINRDFDKIDRDGNKFISEMELAVARQNFFLGADTRLAATGLQMGYKTFAGLKQDGTKDGLGISKDDLSTYAKASNVSEMSWWDRHGEHVELGQTGLWGTLGVMELMEKRSLRSSAPLYLSLAFLNYAQSRSARISRHEKEALIGKQDEIQKMIVQLK